MELSIQEVARATGTTSRTLRHYDDIGLLTPSRIGHNGYRYYDDACLVRLQRILLLRELGLRLPQIALVLDQETSETTALTAHLGWLRQEQDRIARQIASVEATVNALQTRSTLMADTMFDGFDHTKYREEVEERWGKSAYADSDSWWRGLDEGERGAWQRRVTELSKDWSEAAELGIDPAGTEAQDLAARHVDWLRSVPGTPASRHLGGAPTRSSASVPPQSLSPRAAAGPRPQSRRSPESAPATTADQQSQSTPA